MLMFPLFLFPAPLPSRGEPDEKRHNGNAWFRFGPVLIDCAQSARYCWWDGERMRVFVVTDAEDVSQIKAFVSRKICGSLNYSRSNPREGSYICVSVIELHDSVPLSKKPADKSANGSNLIVTVPIALTEEGYLELIYGIASRTKGKPGKNWEDPRGTLGLSSSYTGMDGNYKGLRWNESGWFWFGRGLINCTQSARCSWLDGEEARVVTVTNKTDLLKIKAFAWNNFQFRFGQGPIDPEYRDVVYTNSISFYNIPLPLPQGDQPLPDDNLIIHIPLSSQTTVERDEIITEYHNLMREIANPKEQDNPPKKRKWFLLW